MNTTYLAVDIGASSGRHILGWVEQEKTCLRELYRFENRLSTGMAAFAGMWTAFSRRSSKAWRPAGNRAFPPPLWALTPGLWTLSCWIETGTPGGTPWPTGTAAPGAWTRLVEEQIPFQELYRRTGIQKQEFNTIYQIMAVKQQEPQLLERAQRLLMVPEYLTYRLTGKMENEYTNATTTGLVNARTKTWDGELLDRLGYPRRLFGELRQPGFSVGGFAPQVRERLGFDCKVLLPATHDTGSAFLAVPAKEDGVYLSSGTWSLLGTELPEPITTPESLARNFTNEGGYGYRFRYLKNIMGLWMLQSIRREAGEGVSFNALEQAARAAADFPSRVDVNDGRFLAPENMGEAVSAFCRETGQPVPATLGELAACVYHSLAQSYAQSIQELSALTGKSYTAVNIVGGGSQDGYLNQLTANATGLPVYAGPTEATALGNLMVQMLAAGEFPDLAAARKAVRHSFSIQEVLPC